MHLVAMIVRKCDRLSVQEQAPQAERLCFAIGIRVSISFIASERKAGALRVDPYLVRSPC